MKPYPTKVKNDIQDHTNFLEYISRTRKDDINEQDQLSSKYISGRKVGKVPTSSADTTGDKVGDFNYDGSYIYVCVNIAGVAAWRRATLSSW